MILANPGAKCGWFGAVTRTTLSSALSSAESITFAAWSLSGIARAISNRAGHHAQQGSRPLLSGAGGPSPVVRAYR